MFINCEYCGNKFNRELRRVNEALKMKWKQYCSTNFRAEYRSTSITTFCTNPLCCRRVVRIRSQATQSTHMFCSQSCSAIYHNTLRKNHCLLRVCNRPDCNKYVSSENCHKLFCSKLCRVLYKTGKTSYTPKSVIKMICSFAYNEGRIPTRNELGQLNRLARRFFGTWNNAVSAAGYTPNPVMFANKHIARDGHQCDSLAEKIVDDWLSAHNIEHKIHVPYPWHNGMKCDFWVNDTWVEVFGLAGQHKTYDALKRSKLSLIQQHKLKLISLNLNDVYRDGLEQKLIKLSERRRHPS